MSALDCATLHPRIQQSMSREARTIHSTPATALWSSQGLPLRSRLLHAPRPGHAPQHHAELFVVALFVEASAHVWVSPADSCDHAATPEGARTAAGINELRFELMPNWP